MKRHGVHVACRTELFLAPDLLDRGCRYDDAEAFQPAHKALIAPPRIVSCQANDERSMLLGDSGTPWPSRIGSPLRHHAAMPGQERRWRDQKLGTT